MTDAEIEAKVRELSAFGGVHCSIDAITLAAWSLDSALDAGEFTTLLAASSNSAR